MGKVWGDNRRSKISVVGWEMEQLNKKSLDIIVDDAIRSFHFLVEPHQQNTYVQSNKNKKNAKLG
jgi:hypothetical protein